MDLSNSTWFHKTIQFFPILIKQDLHEEYLISMFYLTRVGEEHNLVFLKKNREIITKSR